MVFFFTVMNILFIAKEGNFSRMFYQPMVVLNNVALFVETTPNN